MVNRISNMSNMLNVICRIIVFSVFNLLVTGSSIHYRNSIVGDMVHYCRGNFDCEYGTCISDNVTLNDVGVCVCQENYSHSIMYPCTVRNNTLLLTYLTLFYIGTRTIHIDHFNNYDLHRPINLAMYILKRNMPFILLAASTSTYNILILLFISEMDVQLNYN